MTGTPTADEIARNYRTPLFRYFISRTHSPDKADDLVQDTLLRVVERLHYYDPSRPLEPWLFCLAANAFADYGRKCQRSIEASSSLVCSEELSTEIREALCIDDPSVDDADLRSYVVRILHRIPADQREAVTLYYLHGYTASECASSLGIPLSAMKGRLWCAKQKLGRFTDLQKVL